LNKSFTTPIRRIALGLVAITVLVGLVVAVAAVRAPSKAALEIALRALPKNTAAPALQRRTIEADLGTGPETIEVVWAHWSHADPVDASPVVLVHGTPSTLFSWTPLASGSNDVAGLAAERDVYALEVTGHGVAPEDSSPASFERCAAMVRAALTALELERVHLVGSSYGGEFAWRAALDAPERIASLVLIDSSGYPRRDGDWLSEEVQMRENPLAKLGWLLNTRERIEYALAPHFDVIPPDRVEEFFLVCSNPSNWSAMVDLARDENGDRAAELTEITAPTLLVWGARDVAYALDFYGRRFERDIPEAELAVVPDSGHYPHEERPGLVAAMLTNFYDGLNETQ